MLEEKRHISIDALFWTFRADWWDYNERKVVQVLRADGAHLENLLFIV